MTDDLHMTDKQYLVALTVFFFPYALFEVCTFPTYKLDKILSSVLASEQPCLEKATAFDVAVVHHVDLGDCYGAYCNCCLLSAR